MELNEFINYCKERNACGPAVSKLERRNNLLDAWEQCTNPEHLVWLMDEFQLFDMTRYWAIGILVEMKEGCAKGNFENSIILEAYRSNPHALSLWDTYHEWLSQQYEDTLKVMERGMKSLKTCFNFNDFYEPVSIGIKNIDRRRMLKFHKIMQKYPGRIPQQSSLEANLYYSNNVEWVFWLLDELQAKDTIRDLGRKFLSKMTKDSEMYQRINRILTHDHQPSAKHLNDLWFIYMAKETSMDINEETKKVVNDVGVINQLKRLLDEN